MNTYELVQESASFLRSRCVSVPEVAIILGTGLGELEDRVQVLNRIPYSTIPHFPATTAEGHRGDLLIGQFGGCNVLIMQGRFHHYEGYTLQEVTFPVRVMRELGCKFLFINSAAGGLNPQFRSGDIMIVIDHINLIPDNPLRGLTDPRLGDRFPDMSRPYDPELIQEASEAALELKIPVRYGIYVGVSGPSLETRAETRMLRMIGADAVGMSTVPEVIVGCQVGFRIMVLAAITNVNIPDTMERISVEKVIENARLAQPKSTAIMEGTLHRIFHR